MPPSRSERRPIVELLDRIEVYVVRHGKLPAALYLELRQAIGQEFADSMSVNLTAKDRPER